MKNYKSIINKILLQTDVQSYSGLEIQKDYAGIEATRYQVYKKVSGSGETVRVGEVGYGAGYPVLPVEILFRKIEKNITVSAVLSDVEALDYAYAKLQTLTPIENIDVKNINLDFYEPKIGDLIQVEDRIEKILKTIVDCESTTGWTGTYSVTVDVAEYVEGIGSIKGTLEIVDDYIYYEFDPIYRAKSISKIGMMIKSDMSGSFLRIKLYYDEINFEYKNINIPSANVWNYFEISYTHPTIKYIYFVPTGNLTAVAEIHVDRIQIQDFERNFYTENIVQINYNITPDTEEVNFQLKNYQFEANKLLFDMEKNIKILENINKSS